MAEKMDRRVRKTKAQLKEGLARLMQKKSINEITVKELVDEVDINRSTFYLHYTDIYQMLQKIEEDAMEDIMQVMKDYPIDPGKDGAFPFMVKFFTILGDNRDLCLALLGANGDMAFVQRIEDLLAGTFLNYLPKEILKDELNVKFIYAYCVNGCIGLIKSWLTESAQCSPEYMATLTYKLVENTTEAVMS